MNFFKISIKLDINTQNRIISKNITKSELKNILDPETYIGLAVKQAQLIIQDIENKRTK